jgi:hypothetical protein
MKEKENFWQKILSFFKFIWTEMIKFPAYILVHPLKGFEEFKRYKRSRYSVAIAFVIIIIILKILKFQASGFLVNDTSIRDLRSFNQVLYWAGGVIVLTASNWAVTTLFDGKGKAGDIFKMICYCVYPMIWATALNIILSNVLALEEVGIYTLVNGLGIFLAAYMFFFGIISIHEYSLIQTLLTILFTLVAVLIILFVGILLFDLFQKVYGFFYQVYQEITLRDLL